MQWYGDRAFQTDGTKSTRISRWEPVGMVKEQWTALEKGGKWGQRRVRGQVLQVLVEHSKVSGYYSKYNGKVLIRGMTRSNFLFPSGCCVKVRLLPFRVKAGRLVRSLFICRDPDETRWGFGQGGGGGGDKSGQVWDWVKCYVLRRKFYH